MPESLHTTLPQSPESANKGLSDLAAVLQAVPVGITVFESVRDADGVLKDLRLVRRNELALAFSRIPAEKYRVGTLLSELMPPELYDNFERMLDVVRHGRELVHELYQPHLDKWILSRVNPHGDGILSTIQDITDIKRSGQEMTQQAKLLAGVLEASPNAISVFEAIRNETNEIVDFRAVLVNELILQTSGYSREEYLRLSLYERLPEQRAVTLPMLRKVVELKEPHQYEYLASATGRWVLSSMTPLGDGFVSTIQDITEQKQISQQIKESAKLLNAVLDSSPMAVVVYESVHGAHNLITDFRPIIANRQALSTASYSAEDFMAVTLLQRNAGREAELLHALREVVLEQKTSIHEHLVPLSGRWVRSITTPFGDGFIATSQDITEQKAQSKIIEEQAELFNGVLSSLQNGLTILRIIRDESGTLADLEYLEVADTVLKNTGRTREQTVGKSMRQLFPGIEETDYWKAYSTAAATGEPVNFETHFTLQGYDNYLLNWVTPLGTDKLVSVYYIVNDLKRAQRELEHTVHELRRSNEDLEQFASIASHDLQEPLRKVQSFGAMLESRYGEALGASGRDLVSRMTNAASRMRNLVTGLLAFARLSGDEHVSLRPVDLNTLIGEIVSDLDQTAEAADGTITIASRLPFVQGIESQLRHLFQNLLTNALKFRKPGIAPVVTIGSGPLQAGDAHRLSPLVNPADYVRLEVRDNGIGFEPDFAEKIFGLFERLHGLNEYQGTGLGLSISRRVAERHEGVIWAEGQPGEGAAFIVLLQKTL